MNLRRPRAVGVRSGQPGKEPISRLGAHADRRPCPETRAKRALRERPAMSVEDSDGNLAPSMRSLGKLAGPSSAQALAQKCVCNIISPCYSLGNCSLLLRSSVEQQPGSAGAPRLVCAATAAATVSRFVRERPRKRASEALATAATESRCVNGDETAGCGGISSPRRCVANFFPAAGCPSTSFQLVRMERLQAGDREAGATRWRLSEFPSPCFLALSKMLTRRTS